MPRILPPIPGFASVFLAAALAPSVLLAGCDAQTTPDYEGESLMRIEGTIQLLVGAPEGELIPAFAFLAGDKVHFVDVDVQGEFPADFVLDVYSPPPQDSQVHDYNHNTFGDETGLSLGYITAVTEDHPLEAAYSVGAGGVGGCTSGGECMVNKRWCTPDQSKCYREKWTCAEGYDFYDLENSDCTLEETKGDVALKDGLWSHFAGLSQEYMVAYLHDDAPEHSNIAWYLGASETGLSAGYHLMKVTENTAEQDLAYEECTAQALALAIEKYNEDHDANIDPTDTSWSCTEGDGAVGECDWPRAKEIYDNTRAAKAELDCLREGHNLTPVPNPDSKHISVTVGPDVRPVSY